jgi:hypothetical protein
VSRNHGGLARAISRRNAEDGDYGHGLLEGAFPIPAKLRGNPLDSWRTKVAPFVLGLAGILNPEHGPAPVPSIPPGWRGASHLARLPPHEMSLARACPVVGRRQHLFLASPSVRRDKCAAKHLIALQERS